MQQSKEDPTSAEKDPESLVGESEPLLSSGLSARRYSEDTAIAGSSTKGKSLSPRLKKGANDIRAQIIKKFEIRAAIRDQCAFYTAEDILSWRAIHRITGSVWERPSLWKIALKMVLLSSIVAFLTFVFVQEPDRFAVGKFLKLSTFLNVFVGLLLGFFISSSMTRWYNCADGLVELCTSVRNLQRDLIALEVDEEKLDRILRYGMLSGWLLELELNIEQMVLGTDEETRREAAVEMWEILCEGNDAQVDPTYGRVYPAEKKALETAGDPACAIWLWVSNLIGQMAKDEIIPPRSSPTYSRLMGLVTQAYTGIRQVRMSVTVQPPYLYVQMLAVLTHLNNIINSLAFGLTWGITLKTSLVYMNISTGFGTTDKSAGNANFGQAARDSQNLLIAFFFSCAGPFIYQALLEVAMAIAQPFSSPEGSVPTRWLLKLLEKDLGDTKKIAKLLPGDPAVMYGVTDTEKTAKLLPEDPSASV